jgi:hypothetical protein
MAYCHKSMLTVVDLELLFLTLTFLLRLRMNRHNRRLACRSLMCILKIKIWKRSLEIGKKIHAAAQIPNMSKT